MAGLHDALLFFCARPVETQACNCAGRTMGTQTCKLWEGNHRFSNHGIPQTIKFRHFLSLLLVIFMATDTIADVIEVP